MSSLVDVVENSEDELVLGVKTKGGGSEEEVSDIGSSLAGISVEGEQSVELSDAIGGENGVLGADVLGEDGLELFLLNFFSAHLDSMRRNKI